MRKQDEHNRKIYNSVQNRLIKKWKNASTGTYISEDFPSQILEIRKDLNTKMKRDTDKKKIGPAIKYDKLIAID